MTSWTPDKKTQKLCERNAKQYKEHRVSLLWHSFSGHVYSVCDLLFWSKLPSGIAFLFRFMSRPNWFTASLTAHQSFPGNLWRTQALIKSTLLRLSWTRGESRWGSSIPSISSASQNNFLAKLQAYLLAELPTTSSKFSLVSGQTNSFVAYTRSNCTGEDVSVAIPFKCLEKSSRIRRSSLLLRSRLVFNFFRTDRVSLCSAIQPELLLCSVESTGVSRFSCCESSLDSETLPSPSSPEFTFLLTKLTSSPSGVLLATFAFTLLLTISVTGVLLEQALPSEFKSSRKDLLGVNVPLSIFFIKRSRFSSRSSFESPLAMRTAVQGQPSWSKLVVSPIERNARSHLERSIQELWESPIRLHELSLGK